MFWKKFKVFRTAVAPANSDETITMLLHHRGEALISLLESAVKTAARKAGYTLNTVDSNDSVGLQIDQVKGARRRGEKAIIINLVQPGIPPDILRVAGDMKVVFLNRAPLDMSILNKNAIFVGPDELMAGRLQGEWMAKYFKGKGQNQIKYILLEGPPELPNAILRKRSVLKELADRGIKASEAVPPIIANYKREEAREKIMPILSSGVKYDIIISTNDEMALGAIKALESLGMDPSKVPIIGIDAIPDAIEAIRLGKMSMTVYQDAIDEGTVAVTALTNMLQGKPINKGTGYDISSENPNVIWIPYFPEPVTKYSIPGSLGYQK